MTKWPLVFLAYLTLLSLSIIDNARGPAYPDILSFFNIDSTRGSFLFAIATAAGLISSLTAKWWLQKFSLTQATSFSLMLLCLGSLFTGFSSKLGLYALDFASLLIGIGMGCSNICMNLLISKGTELKHRRQFFSGLHAVYGIGSFCAPLLLGLSYAFNYPWYVFFMIISTIPLLTFLWAITVNSHNTNSNPQDKAETELNIPFKKRVLIGSIFSFYVASEVMISSRLVYYLELGHQIPLHQARWALSGFFAMLLLGRFLFAAIAFKGSSEMWLKISCLSTLLFISLSLFLNPFWFIMTGLSMSFFYPVGMEWLSRQYSHQLNQLMPSILTSVSIGLVFMHLTFALITDWLGINFAILTAYILQGGALSLIFLYQYLERQK